MEDSEVPSEVCEKAGKEGRLFLEICVTISREERWLACLFATPRFGGVGGAEGGGQTDKRQAVDQPFRGIEVIPAGAVAVVGWVHVVVIVVALAKGQQ